MIGSGMTTMMKRKTNGFMQGRKMKRERSKFDRQHNQFGYHTLEKMCLPNGKHVRVLIWNKGKENDGI